MNTTTITANQYAPFEPYTCAEGYLANRDEEGREVAQCISDWSEGVLPNVIQHAITDARCDVHATLQHFQMRDEEEQSLAISGAWGRLYEPVWGESAPALEQQGREVLKELQQAKLHLDQALHHLERVARLEQ